MNNMYLNILSVTLCEKESGVQFLEAFKRLAAWRNTKSTNRSPAKPVHYFFPPPPFQKDSNASNANKGVVQLIPRTALIVPSWMITNYTSCILWGVYFRNGAYHGSGVLHCGSLHDLIFEKYVAAVLSFGQVPTYQAPLCVTTGLATRFSDEVCTVRILCSFCVHPVICLAMSPNIEIPKIYELNRDVHWKNIFNLKIASTPRLLRLYSLCVVLRTKFSTVLPLSNFILTSIDICSVDLLWTRCNFHLERYISLYAQCK